ncbi:PREDICTED: protein TIFY 10B-like isoform X3 [Erythranthe guttata]|uniref:protein TIFY 10B-like isoform X3 n=1 Tax=Erythranthe guttata TaxID=4155 RepID=UPI00064DB04A|nr:PREDICTED: protein TIFY 10B-like isoform X3 [Erythranthe guttata]|eukprot:XP_012856358.1 PREDICTED: protein TIFY 10B-like isoform X3 [Erythranthe guttata]
MSSSRNFPDGRRREKAAPEKTNFAQTCNLVSRYIKEKGSLRDLNFEIGGKVESLEDLVSVKPAASASTTNVLPNKGKSAQPSSEKHTSLRSSIIIVEDDSNEASTSREETRKVAKNAQLTIFYSGKVLVFDDYSVDNIRELVSVAKKGSSKMSYGILSTNTLQQKPNPGSLREGLPPRPQAGNSLNICKEKINSTADRDVASTSISNEQLSTQSDANDLPIARRSSVHRFMEKRKERAVMRGPYQNQEQRPTSSSKGDQQFDLNT